MKGFKKSGKVYIVMKDFEQGNHTERVGMFAFNSKRGANTFINQCYDEGYDAYIEFNDDGLDLLAQCKHPPTDKPSHGSEGEEVE